MARRAASFFKLDEINVVEQARKNLEPTRDSETNALDEQALIAEVENLLPFDPVRERRRKAERVVRDQARPRKTPAEGSYWLPGFDPAPYEPKQLYPDGQGKTVEKDLATPHFVNASLIRADENLQKQIKAFRRKQLESDEFSVWAIDQALAGRAPREITLGNFLREKGYWSADAIDDDEEPDDD